VVSENKRDQGHCPFPKTSHQERTFWICQRTFYLQRWLLHLP
jgi:hypothetical protein